MTTGTAERSRRRSASAMTRRAARDGVAHEVPAASCARPAHREELARLELGASPGERRSPRTPESPTTRARAPIPRASSAERRCRATVDRGRGASCGGSKKSLTLDPLGSDRAGGGSCRDSVPVPSSAGKSPRPIAALVASRSDSPSGQAPRTVPAGPARSPSPSLSSAARACASAHRLVRRGRRIGARCRPSRSRPRRRPARDDAQVAQAHLSDPSKRRSGHKSSRVRQRVGSSSTMATAMRGRSAGTKPMNDEVRRSSVYLPVAGSAFCAVAVLPATWNPAIAASHAGPPPFGDGDHHLGQRARDVEPARLRAARGEHPRARPPRCRR